MQRQHIRAGCDEHVVDEVLAVALEAYVRADGDGRVLAWNPAAEQAFGYPCEQACGRTVEELFVPEQSRAAHRAGMGRVAAGGPGRVRGQRLQLVVRHADGHEFRSS